MGLKILSNLSDIQLAEGGKRLFFVISIFLAPFLIHGQSGITESYAIVSTNGAADTYYDLNASTANTDFEGANLGTFFSGNTLVLNGAQNKVYKCNTDDITACNFYYRIYKTTDPAPAFTSSNIFHTSDDGLTGSGCGGSDQNQTWESAGAGINVLNGLTSPGNYYIEIFTTADFTYTSGGGGSGTHVANNSGSNYKAQFTLSSDCVSAISVSPSASQSVCQAGSSNQLTATIATSVNFGAGNITYEWYSNTSNSTVAGTLVQTTNTTTATTTNTYTPSATATGTLYYYCVVTNADASCATSTYTTVPVEVTVNANNAVSVSIAASAATICSGSSVTFTATPTNGGSAPIYQWKVNGVNAGTNSATFTTITLANNDVVTVELTSDITPCAIDNPATSNSIPITVNANNAVSVSIAASAATICSGSSVTFTATPINQGSAPIYQWKVNGVNAGTNSATFTTTTLANNDIVTVELTSDITPCATNNPAASNSVTMTVNTRPSPSFSVSPAAAVCSGTSVTYTTQTGGANYVWSVPGVAGTDYTISSGDIGSSSNTVTLSWLTSGSKTVTVNYNNAAGCDGASAALSTVTVNPVLTATVTISANPAGAICEGTNVTFTATPVNGGTTPSYQWKVNGGNVGVNSNIYSSGTLAHGDIVSVVLTSSTTCTSPATKSVTMIVNDVLIPQVTIDASSDEICAGTSVTFTASPVNGGASPFYQWKLNGSNVGSNSSTYTSSSLADGDVVTVDLTSNAACSVPSTVSSNSIPVTVHPNLPVSVSITSDANNICPGGSVTFTATPINEGSSPVYQWKVNGIDVGTNSATFTTATLANNDIVTVELTSNITPCTAGNPATSNAVTMYVNPDLPVSVSISASSTNICPGNSITFIATPTNGGGTPAYQWKVNGINAGTNSNTFTTTSLANNDVVSVNLTSNATPCATGNPATSNSIAITVNPNLPVSVAVAASATTVCTGTSVTFTATPVNGGSTPSYQWTLNGVNTGTNSATFTTTTLSNNDVVAVVLTSNATPCATGSPAVSNNVTMTVNARPTPTFTVSPAATVCSGTGATYTTQSGQSNYIWSVPGVAGTDYTISSGGIGTSDNTVTLTWLTSGTKNVSVNYNNAFSCNGLVAASSTITVNPTLVPSVSISPSATSVCSSPQGTVTFTAVPVNGGTSPAYQWKQNGANIAGATGATYTKSSWGTNSTISVSMTSNYTCASPVTTTSTGILMTIYSGVPSNIASNSITGPTSICPPVSGLVYKVTAVAKAETYVWTLPTGFTITSGSGTDSITVSVGTDAVIDNNDQIITVFARNPCGPGSSKTYKVKVNNFAGIDAGADQSVCAGGSITLAGVWSGNTSSSTWTASSGSFSNASLVNSTYTPSISSGTVTLTLTTNDPDGTCAAASDQMVVTVNQPPAITSQPASQTVCSGSNVTLSAAATGTGLTYQWKKSTTVLTDGGNISGANTATLTLTGVTSTTAGSYSVVVTGTAPCTSVTSSTAVLTVNTAVGITTQPLVTQNACLGGSASISVTATGTGRTYQWRKGTTPLTDGGNISGATTATLTLSPVASGDAASDYNVVISGTAPCTPVTSNNAALVVYEPVSIITQPVSQTVCSGTPVSLSVGATGSGLTYQWKRNGTNVSNSANISGATTATLSILSASTGNAGTYTVTVSGTSPCTAVTSSSATLIVNQLVAITTQPSVTKTVCSGTSTTFTVVASGTGLTYQWRRGSTVLTDNGNISGSNTATLTLNPVLTGDAASDYNVIVSGTSPCSPVTSNNSALVVNEAVNITTQPVSQAGCTGNTVTLTVNATGLGLTYQWKKNGSNLSNSASISGVTTSTLTLTNLAASAAGNYTVLVTGTAPCSAVTSSTAVLTVNQAVAITTQPSNVSVCGTFAVDFSVIATGTGLTYQWYKSPGTPITNTSNISGATTNNLHFTQGNTTDNGTYYVVVSGASPCPSVTSLSKTLDVNESISITTQPVSSQTFCVGSSASFQVVASASDPLDYQWRKNGTNITGATSSIYSIPVLTVADAGNYDVVISGPVGYSCSIAYSSISSLTVTPTVGTPSFTAGAGTVCQDGADETYTATATNNTGITYSVSPVSAGTINTSTGVMNWAADFTGTATITAVASGCSGPSTSNKMVTVSPKSTVTSTGTGVVCSGIAQNYTSTSDMGGATFLWSRAAVSGISNAAVSGQTSNPITETLINTTISPKNVVYAITPIVNGCSGNPGTYTVTVNPLPTASVSGTATVCTGTSPVITFTGSGGTAPYTFTYNINGGSNQTITTISGSSVTLNASTSTSGTYIYNLIGVQDASATACSQTQAGSATITVQQNATITLSSAVGTATQTKCINTGITNISYTVGGSATGASISAGALPAGVTGSFSAGVFTISGTPTASGSFSYTVIATGPCSSSAGLSGTITVDPLPSGGTASSSSNLFVCAGSNGGTVSLAGQIGNITKWQSSIDGGVNWTDINTTTSTISYTNLNQTTWYRAVVAQPNCAGFTAYSAYTVISVVPQTNSLSGIANPTVICTGSSTLTASGIGSNGTIGQLTGGSFDEAGAPLEGDGLWRAYENTTLHNISGSANNGVNPFNLTNGPKEFFSNTSGAVTYTNDPLDGQSNNNKFMVANGPVNSTLETPIFSLVGLSSASIDWYEAYILETGASIKMEISTDGGNTYNFLRSDITGPTTHGIPTNFTKTSVDLTTYVGLSNLRVRFTYAGTTYSSWGLEMATITKASFPASYTWNLYDPAPVIGTPPAHYLNVFTDTSVIVTPPSPNTTNAPIVYHYTLTSSGGGCASNITVTVNPSPVISHNSVSPVCSGTLLSPNIVFSSTLSGTTFTYAITNPGGITGLVTNSNGTISGTPVNPTSTAQTIRFIATGSATFCPGRPDTVDLVVNPALSVVLTGNQTICGSSSATLTLTSTGTFPFNATLSNGITYNVTGSPYNISVSPSTTTTYTITSLSGGCSANGGFSGSAIITVPTGTAPVGTWICGVSTDWFNPCNWGQGVVPTNLIDVTIPNSAPCSPVIDPTSSYAPPDKIARSRDISIGTSQNVSFSNGGDLYVAGNWQNNRGTAGFTANTGTVTMMGSALQTITTTSGSTEAFYNLTINNTSSVTNGVTLNSNITVSNTLNLTNGIVNTHSNPAGGTPNSLGLLTLTTTANPVAGSPGINSFINGQLAKEFTTSGPASEYAYPIGKVVNGVPVYKDMAVQPTSTSGTTTFTSEYFPTAHPIPSAILSLSLVGGVPEYWEVDQSGGTANAKIKIPYVNPGSGNWIGNDNAAVTDPCASCNVAVIRKNLSTNGWDFTDLTGNLNSTQIMANQNSGYIYSASVSSFGPFTNGYAFNLILPVQLLTFEGRLINGNGKLSWTIANPKDLAGFEIESSQDGRNFATLANIPAQSGSMAYGYLHTSISTGLHYYRLLIKDKNGSNFYSKTVLLSGGKNITVIKGLRPTLVTSQTNLSIYSIQSQQVLATLFDAAGRTISEYKSTLIIGENNYPINTTILAKGQYTLHVRTEDGIVANLRFVKE